MRRTKVRHMMEKLSENRTLEFIEYDDKRVVYVIRNKRYDSEPLLTGAEDFSQLAKLKAWVIDPDGTLATCQVDFDGWFTTTHLSMDRTGNHEHREVGRPSYFSFSCSCLKPGSFAGLTDGSVVHLHYREHGFPVRPDRMLKYWRSDRGWIKTVTSIEYFDPTLRFKHVPEKLKEKDLEYIRKCKSFCMSLQKG